MMTAAAAGGDQPTYEIQGPCVRPAAARILVTGSRRYGLEHHVRAVLDADLARYGALVIVHGDNPSRGCPDRHARRWAEDAAAAGKRVTHEPHPADWQGPCRPGCPPGHRRPVFIDVPAGGASYCPAAGHHRNQEMVDLGADACRAFYARGRAGQGGTGDCARRAARAWIPVDAYEDGILITPA